MQLQHNKVATPFYASASTSSTILMNMGVGEAVVTEKVATGSFRKGIAGKVGSGIIEGYLKPQP
ncbi:hypothetical protein [Dehalobacter sp. TBBPA1]|uniref:hypothetical protein n=1 Tax=Dehalobacter sp. TBBPA1 TaxID=3235037 RepID=UPI0034A5BD05